MLNPSVKLSEMNEKQICFCSFECERGRQLSGIFTLVPGLQELMLHCLVQFSVTSLRVCVHDKRSFVSHMCAFRNTFHG